VGRFSERLKKLYVSRGPIGFGVKRSEEYLLTLVKTSDAGEAVNLGADALILPEGEKASIPYGYFFREGMDIKGADFVIIESLDIFPPPISTLLYTERALSDSELMGMKVLPIDAVIMRAGRKLSSILDLARAHIISGKPVLAHISSCDEDFLEVLYTAGVRGIMTDTGSLGEIKALIKEFKPRKERGEPPLIPRLEYKGEDYEDEEDYP